MAMPKWLLAFALVLSVAACGGAAPASGKPAAGAAQGVDQLYAAAKAEGQVTVFAPTPTEIMSQLMTAFSQKYPGVKVNATDLTAGQTVERIVTESAAGKASIDASQASLGSIQPLVQRQLLAQVDWPRLTDGAPSEMLALDGQAVLYYHLPNLIAYNTNLLKNGDVPKQWEDMLRPQFKGGKMLIDSRGNFAGHLGMLWGQDKLLQFARDLKAQQPLFIPRMVEGINRMAAGEAALSTVSMNDLLRFQGKKAPVQITPIQPIAAQPFVAYVLKGAPHPNAARLWTAWAVSKEGRALFEKVGYYALATPGSGSQLEKMLAEAKITVWSPKTIEEVEQSDKHQKLVQDIFTT